MKLIVRCHNDYVYHFVKIPFTVDYLHHTITVYTPGGNHTIDFTTCDYFSDNEIYVVQISEEERDLLKRRYL